MKVNNRAYRAQPRPNRSQGAVPQTAPTAPTPLKGGAVGVGAPRHTETPTTAPTAPTASNPTDSPRADNVIHAPFGRPDSWHRHPSRQPRRPTGGAA